MQPSVLRRSGLLVAGLAGALAVLPGCAGLKPAQRPPQPLVAGGLARLDGDYQNVAARGSYTLLEALFDTGLPDSVETRDYRLHLVLQAHTERAIRVRLFRRATLLAEVVRKGRLQNGCFQLKPCYQLRGLPPLAWALSASRCRLAVGQGDTLLLDTSRSSTGNMLLQFFGGVTASGYQVPFARRR